MSRSQSVKALRSSDYAHELDVLAALVFQKVNSLYRRSACRKHWVADNNKSLVYSIRKLAVILVRLVCDLVTVKTDMTDLCRRNECKKSAYHAKTCPQDRHDSKLFAAEHRELSCGDRCFHLNVLCWKISHSLIAHEHCYLFHKYTELSCSGLFVTHKRYFVLYKRVIDDIYVSHFPISFRNDL